MLERNTRLLGTLVLALALALSAAQPGMAAVGAHATRAAAAQGGLFGSVWNWLVARWSGQNAGGRGLSSLWGAVGPEMDPNGGAAPRSTGTGAPSAVSPTTDVGPGMDPNGK